MDEPYVVVMNGVGTFAYNGFEVKVRRGEATITQTGGIVLEIKPGYVLKSRSFPSPIKIVDVQLHGIRYSLNRDRTVPLSWFAFLRDSCVVVKDLRKYGQAGVIVNKEETNGASN